MQKCQRRPKLPERLQLLRISVLPVREWPEYYHWVQQCHHLVRDLPAHWQKRECAEKSVGNFEKRWEEYNPDSARGAYKEKWIEYWSFQRANQIYKQNRLHFLLWYLRFLQWQRENHGEKVHLYPRNCAGAEGAVRKNDFPPKNIHFLESSLRRKQPRNKELYPWANHKRRVKKSKNIINKLYRAFSSRA